MTTSTADSEPDVAPPGRTRLGLATRSGMRLRHTGRLGREVTRYSIEQRIWWLLPVVALFALLALALTATTHAAPVAVYTLF